METGMIQIQIKPAEIEETILAAVSRIYEKAAQKQISIEMSSDSVQKSVIIPHDQKWTAEVLINLLDNAIKYSPAGACIVIKTESLMTYFRIDIQDEGIGVSKSECHKIFQRFYRSESVKDIEGSGVGLYLAREIMEKQNGSVFVHSDQNRKGSVFSIPYTDFNKAKADAAKVNRRNCMNTILETRDLCKYYGTDENQVKAVNHTSISIEKGEFAAIVGKSGSGKSTLLHLLGGLDIPTSGEVFIGNQSIFSLKEAELAAFRRRKIGFVFQSFNLITSINVWENIVLPIGLDNKKADIPFVEEIIDILGLKDKINSMPNTLSGGQQQRVAIARALAAKPDIILADEPTGNLDSKTSMEVVNLLKVSVRKYGQTLAMITHDEELAQMADRILMIEDGVVTESGKAVS